MPTMTRGPLPPGTYWRRRVFVALLTTGIVFVVATMLGAGGDGTDGGEQVARQAGAESTATTPPSPTSTAMEEPTQQRSPKGKATGRDEPLATPSGRCEAEDIVVTPTTRQAVAGQPIELTLALQTRTDPACHWAVDARRIALRISDDAGEVWSTRHCREGITARDVVVRSAVRTEVVLTWDARRSDEGCPEATEWVLPGEYAVTAAALGGEPTERPLRLYAPGEAPAETEHRAEVRTGNALERLERRQAAEAEE